MVKSLFLTIMKKLFARCEGRGRSKFTKVVSEYVTNTSVISMNLKCLKQSLIDNRQVVRVNFSRTGLSYRRVGNELGVDRHLTDGYAKKMPDIIKCPTEITHIFASGARKPIAIGRPKTTMAVARRPNFENLSL